MATEECAECKEQDELVFSCRSEECQYALCIKCDTDPFKDFSSCPFCAKSTGKRRSVRELVERSVRAKADREGRQVTDQQELGKKQMSSYQEKAEVLGLELKKLLTLKCPRCQTVFDNYDGCNALRCGNVSCEASFCSVCLKDCGSGSATCVFCAWRFERQNHI